MRVRLVLFAAAVLLAGCLPASTNLRPNTQLKPTQGMVVTALECGPEVYYAELYRAGVRSKGYLGSLRRQEGLVCNRGLQIFSMEEGRYFIGKVGGATFLDFAEAEAVMFTVTAGKLNYGGHIRIPSLIKDRTTVLIAPPLVVDRSDQAQAELQRLYPWMSRYEFVKTLAVRPEPAAKPAESEQTEAAGTK